MRWKLARLIFSTAAFSVDFFILSMFNVSRAAPLPLIALRSGERVVCDPKISFNGRNIASCGQNPRGVFTAYWEKLPAAETVADVIRGRYRLPTSPPSNTYDPDDHRADPFGLSTGWVAINSHGLKVWAISDGRIPSLASFWSDSTWDRELDVHHLWSSEVSTLIPDAMDDEGNWVGRLQIRGDSREYAVIADRSGGYRLPLPAGVVGSSQASGINSTGYIGGAMTFAAMRSGRLIPEGHAAIWQPDPTRHVKWEQYHSLPLDFHPRSSELDIRGSRVIGLSHDANPWIAMNVLVRTGSADHLRESYRGVLQKLRGPSVPHFIGEESCRLEDSLDSRLSGLNCFDSFLTAVSSRFAVGQASYSLPEGGVLVAAFYIDLFDPSFRLRDLNRFIPAGRQVVGRPGALWKSLALPTSISADHIVVGYGSFDGDFGSALRGFAVTLTDEWLGR